MSVLRCFECKKVCTNDIQAELILRGTVTCPECEAKEARELCDVDEVGELGRRLWTVAGRLRGCVLPEIVSELEAIADQLAGADPSDY